MQEAHTESLWPRTAIVPEVQLIFEPKEYFRGNLQSFVELHEE